MQACLVSELLGDIANYCPNAHVILTNNVPELNPVCTHGLKNLTIINNPIPRGFAANHNAAWLLSRERLFCVINPDVRLSSDPFKILSGELWRTNAAVIAPVVLSPLGLIEDSIRLFPTPSMLVRKYFGRKVGCYSFQLGEHSFQADWVGGMFMLFRAEDFKRVGGFDEGFYLYYEDVDICARLWKLGRPIIACPQVQVVHNARRTSRHNFRYMQWHMASMIRYLGKHWLCLPKL